MTRREARLYAAGQILTRQMPDLPADLHMMHFRVFGLPALVRLDDGSCVRRGTFIGAAVEQLLGQETVLQPYIRPSDPG